MAIQLVSRFNTTTLFINLLVSGICYLMAFALYDNFFSNVFVLSFNDALSLALFLVASYLLVQIILRKKLYFDEQGFVLLSFFGLSRQRIAYTEINSWYILNRGKASERLYILACRKRSWVFPKDHYSNYSLLFQRLTKGKKQNQIMRLQHRVANNQQQAYWMWSLFVSSLLLTVHFSTQSNLGAHQMVQISGELREDALVNRMRRSLQMELQLKEYPFVFIAGSISAAQYSQAHLQSTFKQGERVQLWISASDYTESIEPKLEKSVPESDFFYQSISVVELSHQQFNYLQLADYNRSENRLNRIAAFASGFLTALFLLIALRLRRYLFAVKK